MKRTVLRLHDAGIPLHTGTDSNAPNVVPGASLHRELRLWVESGIPAEATLGASSVASPRFLGIEGAGSLAPGAPADLAIFSRDPTLDLEALDTLVAVVRDGRLYTRADLDARFARYRARYDRTAFRILVNAPIRAAMTAVTRLLRRGASSP
jgi:imidazolonepropionase-like amidohydrolase